MPVSQNTSQRRSTSRFDNAETVEVTTTVGISEHPRFDGQPAADLSFVLAGGHSGTTITVYDPAVLDQLAERAAAAAAEMRAATGNLDSAMEADDWDDAATNPLGCCATHQPNGVGSPQQHGALGCWWPGPKKGDRVVTRTQLQSTTAVRGTVVEVFEHSDVCPSVPGLLVSWDEPAGGTIRGTIGVFAKVCD